MDCPARQFCIYFTSTILLTTDFCGTIPRATIKTTNLMQWHGTICIVKVFLLSEREISRNYTGIFLDFVHGFGSYVKGLPKTKRCNSVAVTVSVRIRCICETALRFWVCSFFVLCVRLCSFVSVPQWHRLVCGLWLWDYLVILAYFSVSLQILNSRIFLKPFTLVFPWNKRPSDIPNPWWASFKANNLDYFQNLVENEKNLHVQINS